MSQHVSTSFRFVRKLGGVAKRFPALATAAGGLSFIRGMMHGGGIHYVSNSAILELVLAGTNTAQKHDLDFYVEELRADSELRQKFEIESRERGLKKYKSWFDRIDRLNGNIAIYYAMIRELRPSTIVETGTATGSMSSLLLAALHKNECGRLISIDLPAKAGQLSMGIDVAEADTGYWIPHAYRYRWDYRKGDAKLLLPAVLADEKVDVFIHDSLHSTSHMAFEYATARALMAERSVIMSDDILWNPAFDAFARLNGLRAYAPYGNPNIAAVVNSFSEAERSLGIGTVRLPLSVGAERTA